jgi:5-methylcytosine-specific restriction endonuclease McrA
LREILKRITSLNNKERRKRKEKLINMLGGCCSKCGYKKSISALSFHHINPKTKSFDLSKNGNILHDWDEVVKEAMKCVVLCLNCHCELHNVK